MKPDYNDYANSRFEFEGKRFPVHVTDFSYDWTMQTNGNSQTRNRTTVYPKYLEQGSLNISIIFDSVERYQMFAQWVRDYQYAVTSTSTSSLMFYSRKIGHRGIRGGSLGEGVYYKVAIESLPIRRAVGDVAPTVSLTLPILGDMLDTGWMVGYEEEGSHFSNYDTVVDPTQLASGRDLRNTELMFTSKG